MSTISPFAGLLAALGLAAVASAHATSIELTLPLRDVATANLTVSVNGKPVCELSKPIDDKANTDASCRFKAEPGTATWQVQGSYRLPGFFQFTRKGEATFTVQDFAVATGLLAPSDKPYGKRVAAFIAAANRFSHERLAERFPVPLEAHTPATQQAIDDAVKRVGFPLPPDFVSVLREVGALEIGDHSVMSVEEMDDAYTQMRKVWGTPEEAMQSDYSDKFREVLRASTLLFTEVGDGYGGLLYRPGATQACGDQGTYYWTSQEGGTSVLKDAGGRCMDFAAAMRWVFRGFVDEELAEAAGEEPNPTLLIDSTLPTQLVELSIEPGDGFLVGLRARWQVPHE